MRIAITFDVGDAEREAVAKHYGDNPDEPSKATYDTMRDHIQQTVRSNLDDLLYTVQVQQEMGR